MPTSRKNASRRENSVAVPTVVTSRAKDMGNRGLRRDLSRTTPGKSRRRLRHSRCQHGCGRYGARAAFVGKVKDDELGRVFAHDIRAAGVAFDTPPASEGPSTGRCYVLVAPDGERTLNTYLGAAQDLHPRDIDEEAIAGSAITY